MSLNSLPLLASNTDIVATIVVIVAAVIVMSFALALALAAYFNVVKKAEEAKKPAQVKQEENKEDRSEEPKKFAGGKKRINRLYIIFKRYVRRGECLLLPYNHPLLLIGYPDFLLLPYTQPLLLGGGAQLAIAQRCEAQECAPEEEGLTLKESIALAEAATSRHLKINKKTVAEWLTENYGEEIQLNRRKDRTKTGLPLADTHYLFKKGKSKCFIYVYDLSEDKSLLLLRADGATASEIIEQYPSIQKSRFPKSTTEHWCTLVPDVGFETEEQIYDIIAFIISRIMFGDGNKSLAEKPVEAVEDPASEEEGITLKESIALAAAETAKHLNINKKTISDWLVQKYGEALLLNCRNSRTSTGLPLADTHYINKIDNKKCFIYVYDLSEKKSLLLLRADHDTASELIKQYPSIQKSRFPKSTTEHWCTLAPDVGFENEEQIYDIIALIIERLVFGYNKKAKEQLPPVEGVEPVVEEPAEKPAEVTEVDTAEEETPEAEAAVALAEDDNDIAVEGEGLPDKKSEP